MHHFKSEINMKKGGIDTVVIRIQIKNSNTNTNIKVKETTTERKKLITIRLTNAGRKIHK